MMILSIVKQVDNLSDHVMRIVFIDYSYMVVDKYDTSVDIIAKDNMYVGPAWSHIVTVDDISIYWDMLWSMGCNV